MGKKAKKLKTLTGNGTRDIADLLQPRPRPKMAPHIEAYSTSSEEEILDAPDEIPCPGSMNSPQREEDLTAPATKGDIKALLTNIRAFFNADLNIMCEDITVVTARLQANEDAITSLAQKQESTNEHLLQLQASHKSMQVRLDTQDDARRRNNLKIRGIAESVTDQELPHFLRRLWTTLLPQRSAKSIQVDGCYRLAKSNRAPAGVPRDVLIRFPLLRDKLALQDAAKSRTPLKFEEMQLQLLQDLCRSTLEWRRSFQQVTKILRSADVSYKWGPSRALIVQKDGSMHQLSTTEDSATFLQGLGLTMSSDNTARPSHRWDIRRIVPFTPRSADDTG
ncbi:Hypothetical predicted protein [Pelobates cultripes]|uniref:Uncharacterized protein n=1 Tax=Pelobates cultripes TaxID=61616 RepID=A0AAD1SZD3_PELCU|nr:Hypothetical predicted protein [Pelobates cultripes]